MKYYAKQMENDEIIALHTMDRPFPTVEGFVPISETEYTELIAEWEATYQEPEPNAAGGKTVTIAGTGA